MTSHPTVSRLAMGLPGRRRAARHRIRTDDDAPEYRIGEGGEIEPSFSNAGKYSLKVQLGVKNHGHTPADVQSVVLAVIAATGPLPDAPPYQHTPQEGAAFLMPGQGMRITPTLPDMSHDVIEQVRRGELDLYLMGYVDYLDKFGHRHRGGYARRYDRHAAAGTNNLLFVTKRGYNYDSEVDQQG